MCKSKRKVRFLPFQEPITSGESANLDTHGEKIAWSAPDTIPYATAHTMTPALLCVPIHAKVTTPQASVAVTTELKMPRTVSATKPKTKQPRNAPPFKIAAS